MQADVNQGRSARQGERGQVLPLVALSVAILAAIAAFAIDAGYLRFQQRLQQSAADGAAIAGANELSYSAASTRVTSGATMDATSNGYTDDGTNVFVTVNHPPKSGAYNGITTAVEVIIKKNQPSFFWGALSAISGGAVSSPAVTTRAVAALNPTLLSCVVALKDDFVLNGGGGGGISAHNCGIMANGNLKITGQANVDARFIGYVGSGPSGGSYPEGQPTHTVPGMDPCATVTACAYLKALNVSTIPCVTGSQNPAALPPGRYCVGSGYQLPNGSITLAPTATNKLYVFDQAFPTGSLDGSAGATIYNNSGSGIAWSGNVTVKVVAPTSGSTSGMVYFQPLANTGAITKNGKSGSVDFEGGFYAPGSDVTMNGNLPSVSLFVAAGITMNGSGMTVVSAPGLTVNGHAVLAE